MGNTAQNRGAEGKPRLTLLLAAPRGFCAGVDRAIRIVELALQKFGPPVYVRHEIVHNRFVVERLERMGAVFIDELDQAPANARVIFSAHGVPKSVPAEAQRRELFYLDATCPLVSKVHVEAGRHFNAGLEIVLIGHAGHPEVEGTVGQLPEGAISLIETVADAEAFTPKDVAKLAYITQTTLSVDDTAEIVSVLRRRFPLIAGPHKEDICYATTNRQDAVKALARESDLMLVIGSENSSNSQRLVEVAAREGCRAELIDDETEIDPAWLEAAGTVTVTAGASAPESLVERVVGALAGLGPVRVESRNVVAESLRFTLPLELR